MNAILATLVNMALAYLAVQSNIDLVSWESLIAVFIPAGLVGVLSVGE